MRRGAIAAIAMLTGCLPVGRFACSDDAECGPGGACEGEGFCSTPSTTCDSGRRFSKYAPSDIASACVPVDEGSSSSSGGSSSSTTTLQPTTEVDLGTSSSTSGSSSESSSSSSGSVASPCVPQGRVEAEPLLLYDFCEGEGDVIASVGQEDFPLRFVGDIQVAEPLAWVEDGVQILDPPDWPESGRFAGDTPVFELIDPCIDSGEVTVEVWMTPVDTARGPMWFFVLGGDAGTGVSLAQNTAWAELGLRAAVQTNASSDTLLWNGVLFERPTHVVLVRNAEGSELFLDGESLGTTDLVGDLSQWNGNATLSIGGLPGAPQRYWYGTLHMVAFYCEALSPQDVQQNFDAGHRP